MDRTKTNTQNVTYNIMTQQTFRQEMSLKTTNGVGLKIEENITQG